MGTTVTRRGVPVEVAGHFPAKGELAKSFTLVDNNLNDVTLASFGAQRKILNIFPSIDTGVCATSVRKFNAEAAGLHNTVVLCISADLPFAQARFCGAEGIANVITLSTMRSVSFMQDYGVAFVTGPMVGLTARAVVVLDENNQVLHSELVSEVAHEPDYSAALAVLA